MKLLDSKNCNKFFNQEYQLPNKKKIPHRETLENFMQLMEQINSKKPVSKVIRDSLIFKLHFNHNHSVLEISEMFKLSQQYTISLLKTLQRQNNSSQIQEDELAEPIPSDIRIENLIMEQIDSKIGSVTTTSLQQKILSQLGIQISKSAIKFCMKYQLGLSWKRMSHNDPYVNTQQTLCH